MYSTCLFCQSALGRNESVEHFPIGRRLAFDGAKGRLWVVCRTCERWNLTPLEERWEAIEECEKLFRSTRLRVSTEHIGLARLREGLELVRIGEPQRPEMAAWRYGDQFGRRRRRNYALVAGGVAVVGVGVVAGPMMGLVGAGAFGPALNILSFARSLYQTRTVIRVPDGDDTIRVRLVDLKKAKLYFDPDGIVLRTPALRADSTVWTLGNATGEIDLIGEKAIRAAGALLPYLNHTGGSASEVSRAVGYLEEAGNPAELFRRAVIAIEERDAAKWVQAGRTNVLGTLPKAGRLALEMAAHEDSERRALEGELHVLKTAWKDAEEIARIADDMFLPESVDQDLARLKRERDKT
ncbi:MAG: hypothetical protein JWM95_3211 [Gemmatimonadetes bacterium]|nr:hypothetical protein [Gemmatimonadota bacterium]